jgi:WD40 repeat protein
MRYSAFISYSHAADGKLAPKLQRALHDFAKPWYRPRAIRVFRDQTSLAANPALWTAIEAALADSAWFLYMASPEAARSPWVQKEIEWWLAQRGSEQLLIVLTDGELTWDSAAQDFDWSRTTCVPDRLRKQFKDEPLYVDLRWARNDANLSVRHSQFRAALLDIAAPLHGKPKEDLDGEDVRQHRKNKAWAWSAGVALAILAGAATTAAIYAVQQRNEALHQRDEAVARQLRSEAQRLAPIDDQWTPAALLMIESLRRATDATSFEALWNLVQARARPVARYRSTYAGALAFSPDGRMLAMGDEDHVVVVDMRSGQRVARVPFPDALWQVGFDAKGERIVAAGDPSVRVFELSTQREIARLDDGTRPVVRAFSPDSRFAALASGKQVKILDVFGAQVLAQLECDAPVQKIFIAPDGTRVGVVAGKQAWLVETMTAKRIALPALTAEVHSISFSKDGSYARVASAMKDDAVVVEAATGLASAGLSPASVTALFSETDWQLTTEYPFVRVRDIRSATDVATITLNESATSFTWSDDGEIVIIGAGGVHESRMSVFQAGSWRRLSRFTNAATPIQKLAIDPTGDRIAASASGVITIFAAHEGTPLLRLQHPGAPKRLAFSADGKIAAGGFADGTIIVAQTPSSREVTRLRACDNFGDLSLSGNGNRLAIRCRDNKVEIFDVTAGKLPPEIVHGARISPQLSADGKLIFTVQGVTRVLQAADGRELRTIPGDAVGSAAFSPDGRYLAIGSGSVGASLYETAGTHAPVRFEEDEQVESVAFSADGKLLAVGTRSRAAHIYDVATHRRVAVLDHREEEQDVLRIEEMVFAADNRTLATIARNPQGLPSQGATLHVFDIGSQTEIARAPLAEVAPMLRFSADNSAVEFAFGWHSMRTQRVPLRMPELIAAACARVTRNLTPDEWARYFGDAAYHETCPVLNPAATELR